MSHTFTRGDAVEYIGCFVNMRGVGEFLDYDRDDRDGFLWAVVRINGTIDRVAAGNLIPAIDPNLAARAAQLVQVRAASPMRPPAGRTAPVDGLALFDHGRQPDLI